MSCQICGRNACTRSFHSLEEQDLFDQRETMPGDVNLLRRMVQEAAAEILELKACKGDLINSLSNAADALDNAGRELESQSAHNAIAKVEGRS